MQGSGQQRSQSVTAEDADAAFEQLLATPRFELMPFDSIEEEVTYLPDGATITITASPTLGLEATIEWTETLTDRGYDIIPHIAARYVEDDDHLAEISDRLNEAGVTDIFVPGGDREEPIGEFDSAYQLLTSLDDLGYEFEDVGITGYPEGHDFLDEATLAESMEQKEPYATYITTQICYDPEAILEWSEEVADRGVELPIQVGIPGVLNYQRLLGISQKVGVGDSVRFLQKTSGVLDFIKRFIGSRGKYTPEKLVRGIAPYTAVEEHNIAGIHIYTFNQSADTEAWRKDVLGLQ